MFQSRKALDRLLGASVRQLSTKSGENQTGKGRGPISWATLVLTLGAGLGSVMYYNILKERKKSEALNKVESFGKPMLGGPWSLVDASGIPVTSGDFHGKYLLIYFGFTHCPDICPAELVKISSVIRSIEKGENKDKIAPIFISLDPARDSCEQVGQYCKDFHPKMIGLTGTEQQTKAVAKAFRVYYSGVNEDDEDEYMIDHSVVMYLIRPNGEFCEFFTQAMTPMEITAKINKIIKEDKMI